MVRAILAGTKTQTRRICKKAGVPYFVEVKAGRIDGQKRELLKLCPYGQPGDRLWVRETWAAAESPLVEHTFFRADGEGQHGFQGPLSYWKRQDKWKPSIHMPRWASRINLEVTGVRVERLNDIGAADAIAEGIEVFADGLYRDYSEPLAASVKDDPRAGMCFEAVESYRTLWESINGTGSWDLNPWVRVVEFKRLEAAS